MDASQYLPMFLAEAREHLQELNLALVRLEREPEDRGTVDEIFRIVHSFKGMSATMGFAALASVAHEVEEVLELVRMRSGPVDRRVIDVVLECLDALEGAVLSLEAGEGERIDGERLIADLRLLVRREDSEPESEPAGRLEIPETGRLLRVRALLREGTLMPGVRAFQVLEELSAHGKLLQSVPEADAVESFSGREVEAWLRSEDPLELVRRSVLAVSEVEEATITDAKEGGDLGLRETSVRDVSRGETDRQQPGAGEDRARTGGRTVRIDAERLDHLMHLMGELVVHRTRVESLAAQAAVPGLQQAIQDLARSSQALQAMVMQARMIPVEAVFLRFPRVVRDLAAKLGKRVELVLSGSETELDRTVVEALGDPLVHLVRNALDHGLEAPEERLAAGKDPTGRLEIAARHAGGSVVISVSDDGRGIDPALVAGKAVERGLIPAETAASLDAQRALELVFEPGFSTADETSDVSGRGVGMDAVRSALHGLGGEVVLQSQLGRGTTAQIRLPLTLAIVASLLVEAGGQVFAIPIDRIDRTLQLAQYPVRSVAGRRMLVLRDGTLPLLDAAESLGCPSSGAETPNAVVVRSGEGRLALAVERLVGQRELVTRPLPPEVADRAAVSGGAVLSDGAIALIVDCDALVRSESLLLPTSNAA